MGVLSALTMVLRQVLSLRAFEWEETPSPHLESSLWGIGRPFTGEGQGASSMG